MELSKTDMLGNYEPFEYRNEQWTRFPAPKADEAFIMAVDLGQSKTRPLSP